MLPSLVEKRIVLIGGGHAHLQVLAAWKRIKPKHKITLVSGEAETPYSGMVPGFLLGFYSRQEVQINLRKAALDAGAEFVQVNAVRINPSTKSILLDGGKSLSFDIASLNIGGRGEESTSDPRVLQVRPLSLLISQWARMMERLKNWESTQPPKISVVGGGASSFELSLALAKLTRDFSPNPQITLWQREETLATHSISVRRIAAAELRKAGIKVRTGIDVKSWKSGSLEFTSVVTSRDNTGGRGFSASGREDFDFVLLATRAKSTSLYKESALPVTEDGFLKVSSTLQVLGFDFLFGAGDSVELPQPLPHSGVYAVRQGQYLSESLLRYASDQALKPFSPQKHSLALISLGERRALASYGPLGKSAKLLWRLKDRIDRKFMSQF